MPRASESLRRHGKEAKSLLSIYLPAILLTVVGFVVAYQFVQPAPPKQFVMATGPEDGAYYQFALKYREILARNGVDIEIRSSAGSNENLEFLREPGGDVPVAFVQSGVGSPGPDERLLSLASLYYEPLWVFYQGPETVELITDLRGKRLAVGPPGSGTRALSLRILDDSGLGGTAATRLELENHEAARRLLAGEIDAIFLMASPESPLVKELLLANDPRLMHFRRAETYSRRLPFLARTGLPEGVIDLERDIPSADMDLVAATATLVCRGDFHPALIDLLLQAATEVHGDRGIFEGAGEFPAARNLDFPLSADARRFFKHGPPFLQRYLPFWAATLIDRLKIMILPLFFLLLPLSKLVPPVYRWGVRHRIYRWYDQLQLIDREIHSPETRDFTDLEARVDRIEDEALKVTVPLSYARELYNLRLHIVLVRNKLDELRSSSGS